MIVCGELILISRIYPLCREVSQLVMYYLDMKINPFIS